MSMIEDIKRDLEAGTPGPWRHDGYNGAQAYGSCDTIDCAVLGRVATAESLTKQDPDGRTFSASGDEFTNARRIARVPDMEAALLAAEELADAVDEWGAKGRTEATAAALNTALGNYRAATGGAA